MNPPSRVEKLLIASLNAEIEQLSLVKWNEELYAQMNLVQRFTSTDNFPNPAIRQPLIGQAQHFAIQQATDNAFGNNLSYNFRETNPKGASFPIIELKNFVIIPKRSVDHLEWGNAKFIRTLAQANRSLDKDQLDLLTPTSPVVVDSKGNYITNKIMVIADILMYLEKIYFKFMIPSSDLREILVAVSYDDVMSGFDTPINVKAKVNPTSKLKATLKKLDKIASN